MSPTDYETINYRLRPAKCVERKMLCETFHKLTPFDATYKYKYIGFGSISFVDFALFHRSLGIRKMISIDWNDDIDKNARFHFNVPYKCIEIRFGKSNDILPSLPWNDMKSIIWLDYTDRLNIDAISDIENTTSNLEPGSIMLFTFRAVPKDYGENVEERLPNFIKELDDDLIPIDIKPENLEGWNLAETYRKIVFDRISSTLIERNGKLAEEEKIIYKQLFYFCYQDGARMVTTGGIIYKKSQEEAFTKCDFTSLPFVKPENCPPFMIEIPILTLNELRFLDTQLPMLDKDGNMLDGEENLPQGLAIPARDLRRYKNLYRYFPNFTEVEIH
jgi:hypothetical protein